MHLVRSIKDFPFDLVANGSVATIGSFDGLHLGHQKLLQHVLDEAKTQAAEVLKLVPNFSVDTWGERNPMQDRSQVARDMAALRTAGLK